MERDIEELLNRYYEGQSSLEEERYLREFFKGGNIPPHLHDNAAWFQLVDEAAQELPDPERTKNLMKRLTPESRRKRSLFSGKVWQLAASVALFALGFAGGGLYVMQKNGSGTRGLYGSGTSPVENAKYLLAFDQSLKSSASERIQVLNKVRELPDIDSEVTQLLINTLNFDPNVNVRLAACQALSRFGNEPRVAEAFMQSLPIQKDPFLQITLIEALVTLKEKRAMGMLQEVSSDENTMEVVRIKALEGIQNLHGETVQTL